MENGELQSLVEKISLEFFSLPFKHHATFNKRLRTTGGRYFPKDHNLEFNIKSYEKYGIEELIGIIKHELCHYHLHIQHKGYSHRDKCFKDCLKKVNGSRYSKPIYSRKKEFNYKLRCKNCNQFYYRVRKVDINKYRCGKCSGELEINQLKKQEK